MVAMVVVTLMPSTVLVMVVVVVAVTLFITPHKMLTMPARQQRLHEVCLRTNQAAPHSLLLMLCSCN
eukprot:11201274-Lingulodinium_polyedra.AAC.1